jgi:uncharacterized protein (TIGR00369 family)
MTATRRDAAEQARLKSLLTQMFEERISFNQLLGMKVDSLVPGDVRLSLAMKPELVGNFVQGRLHGGVISTLLDALGGLSLMVAIAERHPADNTLQVLNRFAKMGTIDLRVDFLRQGLGRRFIGHGEVTRLGGRVGSTQMRLLNEEGTLIATAAAAYIVS